MSRSRYMYVTELSHREVEGVVKAAKQVTDGLCNCEIIEHF